MAGSDYDLLVTPTVDLEIVPLTAARFPDLAALFEEGGDPRWCWCTYFRVRGRSWSNATATGNRAELERLAGQKRADHVAPGLVAYRDGRAIGWVSLGPHEDYERLAYSKILAPLDDAPVWSIVCFVVSRRARGLGVAAALLEAAIAYARERGATMLEAYRWIRATAAFPRRTPTTARFPCSSAPGSKWWPGASGTPRRRCDRSSASRSPPPSPP